MLVSQVYFFLNQEFKEGFMLPVHFIRRSMMYVNNMDDIETTDEILIRYYEQEMKQQLNWSWKELNTTYPPPPPSTPIKKIVDHAYGSPKFQCTLLKA